MPVWKAVVRPDPECPDVRQGYVRADDEDKARRLVGDDVLLFAKPGMIWPGAPGAAVDWTR